MILIEVKVKVRIIWNYMSALKFKMVKSGIKIFARIRPTKKALGVRHIVRQESS